ncbi:MAG TPA: glycosyltransferase family 4 protein [Actinomycetes bacterium]|nr:glycosyltransferase family 4 protein [Actinomycetes bacterium]
MTGRPVRVLHVIRPELAGSTGGADLHVVDLCAAQAAEGLCEPGVVTLEASEDFMLRAAEAGVTVHAPLARRRGRRRRLAALPAALGADLVHAHGDEADYAAMARLLLPGRRGQPRVMTCHGLIAPDLRHRMTSAIDLWCMRRASALIAVTETAAALLRRRVPRAPVHVITNGVPAPAGRPADAERHRVRAAFGVHGRQPLVGFVGRLSREKRPDLFIRVAERLRERVPSMQFVLVGGGSLRAEVQRTVAASPAADRIVVAGLRHDMDAVYGALDALVLPSDDEGTPRVVLEAQLRRVPVVAAAVGGVPALVGHGLGGLLVPPGRAADLAAAVDRLMTDGALRRGLVERAAEQARTRTAGRMARAVQRVYDAVLPGAASDAGR